MPLLQHQLQQVKNPESLDLEIVCQRQHVSIIGNDWNAKDIGMSKNGHINP